MAVPTGLLAFAKAISSHLAAPPSLANALTATRIHFICSVCRGTKARLIWPNFPRLTGWGWSVASREKSILDRRLWLRVIRIPIRVAQQSLGQLSRHDPPAGPAIAPGNEISQNLNHQNSFIRPHIPKSDVT